MKWFKGVQFMRIRKRAPAHPGRIIKNHHLEPLSMTITDLANVLGVSRKTLSKIVWMNVGHHSRNGPTFIQGFWYISWPLAKPSEKFWFVASFQWFRWLEKSSADKAAGFFDYAWLNLESAFLSDISQNPLFNHVWSFFSEPVPAMASRKNETGYYLEYR